MSSIPDPSTHLFSEWILHGNYYYQAKDIIGLGWAMNLENVRDAYHKGVFPWHIEGMPLPWFCPENRAVLYFNEMHISRSLAKERRRKKYTYTIDEAFEDVVRSCADVPRRGQSGTWITEDYIDVYRRFHVEGGAHSVEVWEEEELIGGLYGIDAGGLFCGESMFFRRSNASKLALLHLVEHLKKRGAKWLDVQVMTPHMKKFGAREINRDVFLRDLKRAQELSLKLFD